MKRTDEDVIVASHQHGSTRSLEAELELDAPIEAVWRALTDADELSNWFPLEAEIRPGVGGSIQMSWDGEGQECGIDAWEPERFLRTTWPGAHQGDPAEPVMVEYHLAGREGSTSLRLVHTGFSADAEWDDEFDSHRRGWSFELRSLQHYLRHHRGTRRHMVKAQLELAIPIEQAWSRITSSRGLAAIGSLEGLAEGDRYDVTTATGDRLTGEVRLAIEPTDFAATVESLDFSLLRLSNGCWKGPGSPVEAKLWLAAYGLPEGELNALEARWQGMLDDLFIESRVA